MRTDPSRDREEAISLCRLPDPGKRVFLVLDTRTPYTLDFAEADGGKNANSLLRWVNPTGEKGPPALDGPLPLQCSPAHRSPAACQGWSETATETIGA
jgi:hypothetical protein